MSLDATLEDLKEYRRNFANELAADLDHEVARKLGEAHLAILAIEAVLTEPPVKKTGASVGFGPAGWPVTLTY